MHRWVFRYVGDKTFDFSSKKKDFCPKTTKFGPKLAFLVNLGQAMQAYSLPCWWVGWWLWRAGCISQDTYLLYYIFSKLKYSQSGSSENRKTCSGRNARMLTECVFPSKSVGEAVKPIYIIPYNKKAVMQHIDNTIESFLLK